MVYVHNNIVDVEK